MRALDVWYDAIDVDRFFAEMGEAARERIENRLRKIRAKNTPEFLFPKFVEHVGELPRIVDDPPLIFHPTPKQIPRIHSRYKDG